MANFLKRESLTFAILFAGVLLLKYSPAIANVIGASDLAPVLFKIGMGGIVVQIWRWVLRMLMPWFRAHVAWGKAIQDGNVAAAICLLAYVLLLMASWWLAAIQ